MANQTATAPAAPEQTVEQPIIATVTARNITPQTGQLRYTLTVGADVYVAFVTTTQLDTLNKLGEKAPKVGEKCQIDPSDVLGRDGTKYCNISL